MIPTTIELNPTELCNLKCNFCPRSVDYPNSNLHMSLETIDITLDHIEEIIAYIPYSGGRLSGPLRLSFTGRGEPVLHKHFRDAVEKIACFRDKHKGIFEFYINTNGYKFEEHLDLYSLVDEVYFNVYYNYTFDQYIEFERQYKNYKNIKVKRRLEGEETEPVNYNTRSGAIVNDLTSVIANDKNYGYCNKPFYNIFIDWNGDYILCCNDWVIMEPLDNVHNTSILDFYQTNPKLQKYKRMLKQERRIMSPCNTCNHYARDRFVRESSPDLVN